MSIWQAVVYFSMGSVLIPISLSAIQFKKLSLQLRLLFLLLVVSFVLDIITFFLSKNRINTSFFGNSFFLIQFTIATIIYSNELGLRKFWMVLVTLFFGYYIFSLVSINGLKNFDSVGNSLSGLLIIVFVLLYFYKELVNLNHTYISRIPLFWISFGFLFYYAGNLILFLIDNFLVRNFEESHRMIWILHNFCNIVKNILFAIALWHNFRNQRSYS